MLPVDLPALSNHQPPAFNSARDCREWLSVQPLANPAQAQTQLLRQLNLLNRFQVPPSERLKILELMRDPIAYAQGEAARRFAARPLPLAEGEQAGLAANRQLWQALLVGYMHCLDAARGGDRDVLPHAGLIIQRAIAAVRAELHDLYQVPLDPPSHLWKILHFLYDAAERLGVAQAPVTDSLQSVHPSTTPQAAYVQALLLYRAGPCELSPRQLQQVERWMQRWSRKVAVLDSAPATAKVAPLAVDLDSSDAAGAEPARMTRPRWLELSALASSIKKRITRLKQGDTPESLKLGDDCVQPACENLLRHLYRHWFKGGAPRAYVRHAGQGTCRIVGGVEAIHYYMSGRIFRQPGASGVSKREADEIATFGRIAMRYDEDFSQQHGYIIESWRLLDESPVGLRIVRAVDQPGVRLAAGRLLAVHPGEARGFLLAMIRWIRITGDDQLQCGVAIFPGTPRCVAVKGSGLAAANDKYRQGFILPAAPALNEPESVIVPVGWFRRGRVIEMVDDALKQVSLTRLVERGTDFERALFDRI